MLFARPKAVIFLAATTLQNLTLGNNEVHSIKLQCEKKSLTSFLCLWPVLHVIWETLTSKILYRQGFNIWNRLSDGAQTFPDLSELLLFSVNEIT